MRLCASKKPLSTKLTGQGYKTATADTAGVKERLCGEKLLVFISLRVIITDDALSWELKE